MSEAKKSYKADLERRRVEMFLAALVLVLSCVYVTLEWRVTLSDDDYDANIEDIIEDIDFEKLKKNHDMVAAISHDEDPQEASRVKAVDQAADQQAVKPLSIDLIEGLAQSEVPQASLEEMRPMLSENDIRVPEGYHVVEQLPEFPGGASAFMKWITEHLKYPKSAQNSKIKGKVVVSFIVDTEGSVTKLKLEHSDNRQLGLAVMRVMGTMPKWKPGIENGKPCSTMVAVPINFEL